jgi:hypothetical protein
LLPKHRLFCCSSAGAVVFVSSTLCKAVGEVVVYGWGLGLLSNAYCSAHAFR